MSPPSGIRSRSSRRSVAAAHHLGPIGCGLVLKLAVNDLLAVQVAWVNDCFQAAPIMQAMTVMVKVFGCRPSQVEREAWGRRTETAQARTRGAQVRRYGDLKILVWPYG
jgi:hypothetical protein